MGVRENKDLLRRLYEEGYVGAPEQLDRYFTPSYRDHSMWADLAGLKSALKAFRAVYHGVTWRVDDMVGEGDKVTVRATMKIGSAVGPARSVGAITIYRFEGPKIAETWAYGDKIF